MEQIEKYIIILSVLLTLTLVVIVSQKLMKQYKKYTAVITLSVIFLVLGGFIEILNQHQISFTLSDSLETLLLAVGGITFLFALSKILELTSRNLSGYRMTLEIINAINSSPSLDNLFQEIIELSVKEIKNAERGSVVKYENGYFVFVASSGYNLNKLRSIQIPEKYFAQPAENVGIFENIYQHDKTLPTEMKNFLKDEGIDKIRTTLITKIIVGGKVYGYFNLDSKKKDAFNENDLNSMRILSSYIGTNLENALLLKKLEMMYNHDQLTGLYNRYMFDKVEKMNWKTVILFDVDNMKKINDTFGHRTGDAVLKKFSQVLSSSCRREDFAIRIGGDEFIAVQRETVEDARVIARRISEKLSQAFEFEGKTLHIHASYGIASFEEVKGDFQKALQLADERMYQLKSSNQPLERF